jgi:putative endonuclease
MAKHITLGKLGEQVSVDYLLKNAYTIEARNYRYKRAEIDIIARKGDLLIFIEVKSLSRLSHGHPEEKITQNKIRLLNRAARAYQYQHKWHQEVRFDSISVNFYPQAFKIEHFEDAFS